MKHVFTLLAFCTMAMLTTFGQIKEVVNLNGAWKFAIGDEKAWAHPRFNDAAWDEIQAPDSWENQGYMAYDGYAWYRKKITIPNTTHNHALMLSFGQIDDVNQVYFNGILIGQMGKFPPKFVTAYNAGLIYHIPEEIINFNGENTIAVRVYDETLDGGIVGGNLMIGIDRNIRLLNVDLSGNWRFSLKNHKDCINTNFDDSDWKTLWVPASWESQGYNDYNGNAWYRKTFELPGNLAEQKLYLVLGKIDDYDKVYLNGKQIADYTDMFDTPLGTRYNGTWQMRRAYKIPKGLLIPNGKNTIAVLVHDDGGMGGIHEGPVGLMTKENYDQYVLDNKVEEHYFPYSLFDVIVNGIFD